MTRFFMALAILLGVTYLLWGVFVLPYEAPPLALVFGSMFCSTVCVALRRRSGVDRPE